MDKSTKLVLDPHKNFERATKPNYHQEQKLSYCHVLSSEQPLNNYNRALAKILNWEKIYGESIEED